MRRSLARLPAFVLVVAALGVPREAPAVATVYLDPESTSVCAGQEFDLRLMINDEIDTISNFQVFIRFDPNVIDVAGVEEGSLYTNSGYQTFFHVEEESLGTWEIFEVIFPYTSFVLAPGELAVVHFYAMTPGETSFDFLSAVVMDIDRVEIAPLASAGGHVRVAEGVGVGSADGRAQAWDLGDPYPNPSRGAARIQLTRASGARDDCVLSVYDVGGRLVRSLVASPGADRAEILWDGRDDRAEEVPSGLYFFRLEAQGKELRRKIILFR